MHEMLTACSDGRSLATIRTSLVMIMVMGWCWWKCKMMCWLLMVADDHKVWTAVDFYIWTSLIVMLRRRLQAYCSLASDVWWWEGYKVNDLLFSLKVHISSSMICWLVLLLSLTWAKGASRRSSDCFLTLRCPALRPEVKVSGLTSEKKPNSKFDKTLSTLHLYLCNIFASSSLSIWMFLFNLAAGNNLGEIAGKMFAWRIRYQIPV